jgi:predicted RNA binding protein YcfA (HicA-like mRNA interferase family)
MSGKEVLRIITKLGGEVVRQRGSHVRVRCGSCGSTVPMTGSRDLPPGTLRAIERDLEPELGEGWPRKR